MGRRFSSSADSQKMDESKENDEWDHGDDTAGDGGFGNMGCFIG
jgi:hypothetical protein